MSEKKSQRPPASPSDDEEKAPPKSHGRHPIAQHEEPVRYWCAFHTFGAPVSVAKAEQMSDGIIGVWPRGRMTFALVQAKSIHEARAALAKHWPDAKESFVEEQAAGWEPGEHFTAAEGAKQL